MDTTLRTDGAIARPESSRRSRRRRAWRHEIDGLRAIAISLIIGFHLTGDGVSGGVDVFFVLSGYLLIAGLVAKLETGRFKLRRQLLGTFQRLFLPLGLVLIPTILFCRVFFPESRWEDLAAQFQAVGLGFQNLWLAHISVDYYASDGAAKSPVQHLWSLSLQSQVFVLFPLLMAALWWACRQHRNVFRLLTIVALASITVVSAWHGVVATSNIESAPAAYFWTSTRLWEFSLGGLVSLVPSLSRGRRAFIWCQIAAWAAVAVLFVGPFIWVKNALFPGPVAWIPTAACAVFLTATKPSGDALPRSRASLQRVLGCRPLRWVGSHSLLLYLWHWPILVGYLTVTQQPAVGIVGVVIVVGATGVLSWLSMRSIHAWSAVARRVPAGGPLSLATMSLAVASTLLATNSTSYDRPIAAAEHDRPLQQQSLAQKVAPPPADPDQIRPRPQELKTSWFERGRKCTATETDRVLHERKACSVFRPELGGRTEWMVIGDSHAQQISPAIYELAQGLDVSVRSYLQPGCRYPGIAETQEGYVECGEFVQHTQAEVLRRRPDVVFMIGTRSLSSSPGEVMVDGLAEAVGKLTDQQIRVVLIRDNPRFEVNMYECGELKGWTSAHCAQDLRPQVPDANPLDALASGNALVHAVDLTAVICPGRQCMPSKNQTAIFRDSNHLSTAFAITLAPSLASQLGKTPVLAGR